jgi:hypothetical protein
VNVREFSLHPRRPICTIDGHLPRGQGQQHGRAVTAAFALQGSPQANARRNRSDERRDKERCEEQRAYAELRSSGRRLRPALGMSAPA